MRYLLVAVAVLSCLETRGEDVVHSTVVDAVDVQLFVPHEADVVRGLILHVANYKMNPADRWAEAGRGMKFGHVQLLMDLKRNNRPVIMRKALDAALSQFAREHHRPELLHAPFVGTGHSAGGMCTSVLLKSPERTLTNMVSCGWVMDPAKNNDAANAAPYLATIGAIPDAFKMIPTIQTNYDPARAKGLPWGLGFMWGCAHDFGNSATLFIPWMEAITEMRFPLLCFRFDILNDTVGTILITIGVARLLYLAGLVAMLGNTSFNIRLGPAGLLLLPVFAAPLIHLFVSTSRLKRAAETGMVEPPPPGGFPVYLPPDDFSAR